MKKYLVLYESTAAAAEQMAKSTPEQAKAGMDAWMKWAGKAGSAIVDLGSPLQAVGRVDGGKAAAGKSSAAGFSVLQADSKEAVMKVLEGHPHLMMPGNAIEVLEFLPIPGM